LPDGDSVLGLSTYSAGFAMKSFFQILVPVALLMAVVAVVAYMTANTSRTLIPEAQKPPEPAPTQGDLISWDDEGSEVDPRPIEVESPSHPHKDFWFHTNQSGDVRLGLWYKSCGCANIHFGVSNLSDEEWESIAAAPSLGSVCRLLESMEFAPMKETKKNEHEIIRAARQGKTPRPYVLRLNWEVNKSPTEAPGDLKLHIEVNSTLEAGAPQVAERNITYTIVPAVSWVPGTLDIGDISPGGKGTRDLIVWSPTRDRLDFTAHVTAADDKRLSEPCAEISEAQRLTDQELAELPKSLGPDMKKFRAKSAYRIRVTVHERRGGHQLEIGPMTRALVISVKSGPGEEPLRDKKVQFAALVRGDVSVLNGDDVGRVNFGTFKFDRPRSVEVRLGSIDPKLDLELESTSDPHVHATFVGEPKNVDGRREWSLRVELDANTVLGEFARQIILKVKGGSEVRRLRIPVGGNAER
jgi:hypothetical protein